MNERKDAIRDARTLGVPKMLLLGLQHMFAMFGATILVPILVNSYFEGEGLSVQVTLICAGLGTLFFHLCTKLKVPAFLGSSFAFLGGFSTIAQLDTGIFADGHDHPHGTENYPASPPGPLRQARYSAGGLFYTGGRGENCFSVRQRRRRAKRAV